MSQNRNPISDRQLAANRRNSQKSTGPKSQTGKENTRYNALKHGLTAQTVCIPGESYADYEDRRQQYIDHFKPQNLVEFDLVDDLAASRWRKRRAVKQETILVHLEVEAQRQSPNPRVTEATPDVESTVAVQLLSDYSQSLKLLDRYETRIDRSIERTLRALYDIQRNRPPAEGPIPVYPFDSESVTAPAPPAETQAPEPGPAPSPELPNQAIPENGHDYQRTATTLFIVHQRPSEPPRRPKPQPENSPFTAEPEKFLAAV